MRLERTMAIALLLGLAGGCAMHGATPAAPFSGAPAARPHSVFWGIGLSGFISATVPHGLTSRKFETLFCQVKEKQGCPFFSLGVRSYHTKLHKTIRWSGGMFSASTAPSATLGDFAFNQTVSTTSSSNHVFQAAEDMEGWDFVDVIAVTSSSLPVGTPASFKVTTTLKPSSIKAPCNADSSPSLTFYFNSNGIKGTYSRLNGGCVKKKFAIYVDTPGKPGTVLTAVITGAVGQNMNIEGKGMVTNGICAVVGCIPQTSTLAGTVKFTIVPITKGASFKADSGVKYQ
ncbi:MAG: hypothetical protein JO092_01790 [Candidatus Eremiobacteraeota bacterium]|nr:hypothetical protein [Candidatus Eremiobacteraeota bacterium]